MSSRAGLGGIDPRLYKVSGTTDSDDEDYDPPDNHIGRVWFSVRYEAHSEKLLVTLVKARNLATTSSTAAAASCRHGNNAAAASAATPSSGAGDFFVR